LVIGPRLAKKQQPVNNYVPDRQIARKLPEVLGLRPRIADLVEIARLDPRGALVA
jgi:hypothetical protein